MYPGEGMFAMVKKEYELCAVFLCLVILYGLHWYWYSIFEDSEEEYRWVTTIRLVDS